MNYKGYNVAVDIQKANKILLEITNKYQNLAVEGIKLPVPYFINTAEQAYKQAMKDVGIEKDLIAKTMQLIRDGKTPLGSAAGKGTPEEIEDDMKRLAQSLKDEGYGIGDTVLMRKWMGEMHTGLDCSGYVYNILVAVEKDQGIEILKKLAWALPESMKPTHAGAFIFDSDNLERITEYSSLQPLDIFIRTNHTHVGILAEYEGHMCLADCSMSRDGITFSKIDLIDGDLIVDKYDSWSNHIKNGEVVIRRLVF